WSSITIPAGRRALGACHRSTTGRAQRGILRRRSSIPCRANCLKRISRSGRSRWRHPVFNLEIKDRGFSAGLFVAQLFLAPFGSLIGGLFAGTVIAVVGEVADLRTSFIGNLADGALGYGAFAAVGYLLGTGAQGVLPRCRVSGGAW